MTQKPSPSVAVKKDGGILRALGDLVLLVLLLAAAGFGGYFWGIHQQLAPVLKVGLGTPGAMLPSQLTSLFPGGTKAQATSTTTASSNAKESSSPSPAKSGGSKFWLCSTGSDYTGYAITVKVNGVAVDNFFGPGKTVDVTRLVKAGQNNLDFDAKELGKDYNKHAGDAKSKLTLQLVKGAHVSEEFPASDIVLSYTRTAAETTDFNDTLNFSGD